MTGVVVLGLLAVVFVLSVRRDRAGSLSYLATVPTTGEERSELLATAYHEAAHFAVLYALLPEAVASVTIVPSRYALGAVFHAPLSAKHDDVAGVLYFAGFWGEVLSGVPQSKARLGAFSDFLKVAPVITQFVDEQRAPGMTSTVPGDAPPLEQARGHYQAQAFVRVTNLWGSIESIANALLRAGTLDREAVINAFLAGRDAPADEVRAKLLAGWRRSQAGEGEST